MLWVWFNCLLQGKDQEHLTFEAWLFQSAAEVGTATATATIAHSEYQALENWLNSYLLVSVSLS